MVSINPEVGHEQMASLNYTHGIAQALWAGGCSSLPLGAPAPRRYQIVVMKGDAVRPALGLGPRPRTP
jgi:hypothetical protein